MTSNCFAQNLQFDYNYQPKTQNLPIYAWAGGLNSPQIYSMDLNQDLEEDLVIFDKHNEKFYTFIANPQIKKYSYRPEFEQGFPKCKNWVVIIDANNDGKKDIFTHSDMGVRFFKNISTNFVNFELIQSNLTTKNPDNPQNIESQILIPATDMPSFVDIDADGDLDIFTFDFAQGNWIEFHENITPTPSNPQRRGNNNPKITNEEKTKKNKNEIIDTTKNVKVNEKMVFVKKNPCWGGILEKINCGEFEFNKACAGGGNTKNQLHAGSTIQLIDLNGDKKLDVLIGDISCNELYFFQNKGTNTRPKFTQFDKNFPKENPIRLLFPAVYFVDVTFDKIPDMLAVPNALMQDGEVSHWDKSIHVYENKNTQKKPDWKLIKTDFLQNDMLDLGENLSAFAFDIDNDKDMDLLLSAKKSNGNIDNSLLENQGTNKNPIFAKNDDFQAKYLVDSLKNKIFQNHFIYKSNYLQNYISFLQKINDNNIHQSKKQFYLYYKNIKLDEFHKFPFPLQRNDSPALIDIDEDGDIDVCVAKGNGSFLWHENIRIKNKNTKKKDFTEDIFLAEKILFDKTPNSLQTELKIATHDINADGQVDLLMTDADGGIKIYLDIAQKFNDFYNTPAKDMMDRQNTFWADYSVKKQEITKENTKTENTNETMFLGNGIFPQIMDLDADDMPELLFGMRTGGLKFAKNISEKPKVIAKYYKKDNMLVLNVPFSGQLRGENAQGELLFNIAVGEFRDIFPVKLTEKQIQGLKVSHRNPRYKTLWLKNLVVLP